MCHRRDPWRFLRGHMRPVGGNADLSAIAPYFLTEVYLICRINSS